MLLSTAGNSDRRISQNPIKLTLKQFIGRTYLHRHAILNERRAREMALIYFIPYTFASVSSTYTGILFVYVLWVHERFRFESPLYLEMNKVRLQNYKLQSFL